ncbi:MAG TPA: DUF1501 domain-containing protein [Pirellulales bacterium]|nr:DUF1501 domain-containing protein [Pirellulales bacterium]
MRATNSTGQRSRRSFLQAGALGVGGLTLADWLRLRAEGAARPAAERTSVILFWLSGGPGHMETWDPKPLAPAEYRGPLGAIDTNVPGIQFSELMPEQAKLMDRLAVVRTVNHGSPGQYKTEVGARLLTPPLDRAISALVSDLIDRGLYERTLVVAMGEFGRTPRMNANAGRDHWGNTFSVLFGCGSMKMGQAIGRSSARGEHVVDRPFDPQDVAATVYHHLGIDAQNVMFPDHRGRPLALLDRGEPIRELVG